MVPEIGPGDPAYNVYVPVSRAFLLPLQLSFLSLICGARV